MELSGFIGYGIPTVTACLGMVPLTGLMAPNIAFLIVSYYGLWVTNVWKRYTISAQRYALLSDELGTNKLRETE